MALDSSVKFYSVYIIIYLTIPSYYQFKIFFFFVLPFFCLWSLSLGEDRTSSDSVPRLPFPGCRHFYPSLLLIHDTSFCKSHFPFQCPASLQWNLLPCQAPWAARRMWSLFSACLGIFLLFHWNQTFNLKIFLPCLPTPAHSLVAGVWSLHLVVILGSELKPVETLCVSRSHL